MELSVESKREKQIDLLRRDRRALRSRNIFLNFAGPRKVRSRKEELRSLTDVTSLRCDYGLASEWKSDRL
jgi:hypothetical protein